MKFIIISGLSGSGKSEALKTLEDANFYCVDNLPVGLLDAFGERVVRDRLLPFTQFAVCIDARNQPEELEQLDEIIHRVRSMGLKVEIIFFTSSHETLIKRFSETRRKHPLSTPSRPLENAIEYERKVLEPLISIADLVVDTSHTTVPQLRQLVRERVVHSRNEHLQILVESFGFKRGVPIDSDFVFDVRSLPNPHWIKELKELTGLDQPVVDYLKSHPIVQEMATDIIRFLDRWIISFAENQRYYLTIAIGCTGGQHRSVYITEIIAAHLRQHWDQVNVRHRDLRR